MKEIYGLKGIRNALVGIGVSLALLTVGAMIAVRSPAPQGLLTPFAYIALVTGAAVCGALTGRSGMTAGESLLAAAIYALLPLTCSLILGGTDGFWVRSLLYLGMGGIAGGIAWLIPPARRRRRYRY